MATQCQSTAGTLRNGPYLPKSQILSLAKTKKYLPTTDTSLSLFVNTEGPQTIPYNSYIPATLTPAQAISISKINLL